MLSIRPILPGFQGGSEKTQMQNGSREDKLFMLLPANLWAQAFYAASS
jgi:hypothetical protein